MGALTDDVMVWVVYRSTGENNATLPLTERDLHPPESPDYCSQS